MNRQFIIRQLINKNIYSLFKIIKQLITRQLTWIYCLSMSFIYYMEYGLNNDLKKDLSYLNSAKKGNVLVRVSAGGGAKSRGSVTVYGRLLELKDTSEVDVFAASGNHYFVRSIPPPDSGDIYPVWYTSDKKLILARAEETKVGMREFLIKRSEKGRNNLNFFYWGLTIFLLIGLCIDFIRGKIREG